MTRLVVLCRHGNTFNPGETVVMVGAREDLPLTEMGRGQARRVSRAILGSGARVTKIMTGPLLRTSDYAAIMSHEIGYEGSIVVDDRLREIDFGAWGGLSDDEIVARTGREPLRRWQEDGVRPPGVDFQPSQERLEEEIHSLLHELESGQGVSVIVTSNGRLREISRLLARGSAVGRKVKTGNACVIEYAGEEWRVVAWDVEPEELQRTVARAVQSIVRQ